MAPRVRLRPRSYFSTLLFTFCFLVCLFAALNVHAEGLLPDRERHRERHRDHAVQAARQYYKRKYANDTETTKHTQTHAPGPKTTETSLQSVMAGLLNEAYDGILGSSVAMPPTTSGTNSPHSFA